MMNEARMQEENVHSGEWAGCPIVGKVPLAEPGSVTLLIAY